MCFFTSAMQIDLEAVTLTTMVPSTFTVPTRWSARREVSESRIQLNSAIASNLQRLPPERVQVEVPESVVDFGLRKQLQLQLTPRPSRLPTRRHEKRRPEDRLTLMPSQCGRQKLQPKQLRSLQFDSRFAK